MLQILIIFEIYLFIVPPTNEDLPDLYEVMGSLDTDEIQLNLKTSPPSIMDSDQQKIHQKQVLELKQGLAEEEIKVYLDEFEKQVEQEILMIGNISLEDVQVSTCYTVTTCFSHERLQVVM